MKGLVAAGLVGVGLAAAYQYSDRFEEAGSYVQDTVREWTAFGDGDPTWPVPAEDWVGLPPPAFSLEFYWQQAMTTHRVAVGDLNGDGSDDIVALGQAGEYEPRQLYLYFQRPDGTMPDEPVLHPMPEGLGSVLSMSLGDLNEDGRQDIVFTSNLVVGFYYFLSQPGGGFAWREDDWINAPPIMEAALGDIDRDGHLDVITHVSLNYTDYQHYPYRELIVTNFGNGLGGFDRHSAEMPQDEYSHEGLALGDLTSDGLPDLVTIAWPTPLLRRHDGVSGFLPAVRNQVRWYESYGSVVIGDVTGDGLPDYTFGAGGRLVTYPQLPGGNLAGTPLLARGGSTELKSADLNGDGRSDLLFVNQNQGLGYALHGAYGLEYPVWLSTGSVNKNGLATGDLNSDGVTDIVVAIGYGGLRIARGKLTPYTGPGNRPGPPSISAATWLDPDPQLSVDSRRYAFNVAPPPGGYGKNRITGYSVYSIPGGTVDMQEGSTATTHVMTGLEANTTYTFYARAHNAAGTGPASALSPPLVLGFPPDPNPNPPITLSISAPASSEGFSGPRYAPLSASLSRRAPDGGVSFRISTRDGDAVAGVDYVPVTALQLTIPEGEQSIGYPMRFIGDTAVEPDEHFFVDVSDVQGATPIATSAQALIINDDTPEPRIYIEGATVVEGNVGNTACLMNVRLTEAVPHDVTFSIWTTGTGHAYDGQDYVRHFVTNERIPAGQTKFTLAVPVMSDVLFEQDEEFEVQIWPTAGANSVDYPNSNWCTILNDDAEPSLSIGDATFLEGSRGNWTARLRAELTAPLSVEATFNAVVVDGTAKSGNDFAGRYLAGVKIPPGQSGVDVQFEVFGDTRPEPTESFSVQLSHPHNVKITDGSAVVTLIDEDIPNGISVDNVRITEGAAGSQSEAVFVVRLSEPSPVPVSFDLFTASGTAVDSRDFIGKQQPGGVIPAGALSTTFSVLVLGDDEVEMDEHFTVNLVDVVGATISDSQGIATIVNDELATLSVEDVTIVEGNAGNTAAVFVLRLSRPMPTRVTFDAYSDVGTADSWSDFKFVNKSGVIDAGRTTARISVDIFGDPHFEPDETFYLRVSNVKGAVLVKNPGVATVINDDPSPAGP